MKNYSKHNLKTLTLKADDDDDDDMLPRMLGGQQHLPFFQNTQQVRFIKAYLDEDIKEAKYYRPLIQAIENLAEHDGVQISINSHGGYLDGAIALINAMQASEGQVQVCIDGVAASAASLIALASPSLVVGPYASMMIHAATFGSFGKQSDVMSHASFIDKKIKKLMYDVYKDFLTDKEFEEVMLGKELWFTSEEIIERLELREKLIMDRLQAEEEAANKPAPKPRKTPAKKAASKSAKN